MLGVLAGRVTTSAALVAAILVISASPAAAAGTRHQHRHNHHDRTPTTPGPTFAKLQLTVPDAFIVGKQLVTVPGRAVHVHGIVRPFVPGQWVLVRASVNGSSSRPSSCASASRRAARAGQFTAVMKSPRAGHRHGAGRAHARRRDGGATQFPALHRGQPARRVRLARAVRRADPAAAGRASLLHPADRRLRLGDGPRDRRLPPPAAVGHLRDARQPDDQLPARRLRAVQGALPAATASTPRAI